jgi:hypothetical protein
MFKFIILLIVIHLILLTVIFNVFIANSGKHKVLRKIPVIHSENTYISRNKTSFKILLWTKYFGSNHWVDLNLQDLKCEYSNCILTENRNDLNNSDALLLNWKDISDRDVPEYHLTHQKWVLYNWESPHNSPVGALEPFEDQINWTMSYRQDSDIFIPYGKIFKCDKNLKNKHKFYEKNKSIAWIVSNCETDSRREDYVKKLRKYIDVDIYGKCGDFECSEDNGSLCYEMIAKNYKFYLSFENSVSFLKKISHLKK